MSGVANSSLLTVKDLTIGFGAPGAEVDIVESFSLDVSAGETVALVGESGCGKTTVALSLMGLNPPGVQIRSGSIRFDGAELTELTDRSYRQLRGGPMAMVFQDPMSSLNPLRKVGNQIGEALTIHQAGLSRESVNERVVDLLRSVGISDPAQRARQHPHEYSGGMRQRAMIALAIANQPRLLIADEPTTALDATIQGQIIEVLLEAKRSTGAALILVTHDLGLVGELADRVAVMYAGRLVEIAPATELFDNPQHPYTVGLVDLIPRLGGRRTPRSAIPGQAPLPGRRPSGCAFHPRCARGCYEPGCATQRPELSEHRSHATACFFAGALRRKSDSELVHRPLIDAAAGPLLTIDSLQVGFPIKRGILRRHIGTVRAVDGVSLVVPRGKTAALVGESGSGKSTLARAIVGLTDVDAGSIVVDGLGDVVGRTDERQFRRRVQLVFQDPYTSLNPRMPLGAIVGEPLRVYGIARGGELGRRVDDLFELVGLDGSMTSRYPHELSGGQRQRVGLARALALEPDLIILDEPASALDVSVQAQIVALLVRLQAELGLAYLLIAHDLALVEQIADRVAVMYFGRIVEHGDVEQVLGNPRHPYTQSLIASTSGHGRSAGRAQVRGEPPSPLDPPSGCAFRSRCRHAIDECATIDPGLTTAPNGALVACIRSPDLDDASAVIPVETPGRLT